MEEIESTGYLRGVEPGVFLRQPPVSLHVEHEVTAIDTLDHKEEPLREEGGRREGGGRREEGRGEE